MNPKLGVFKVIIIGVLLFCEVQANNWHSYLSYYQTIAIVQGDQKIFAANANGLFSYDLSGHNFETKSRVEGLSDSGISAINWSAAKRGLLIGYTNGNLDLLIGNVILNLPDLKFKSSIVNKSINNIFCEGDFAWLSCNFGIVKINLKRWEVAETWIIGPDATSLPVNELTIDDRYFWAATEAGIFRADKTNPNLQDYRNWVLQDRLPFPKNRFSSIALYGNKIYTCDTDDKIYSFDGTNWQYVYSEISGIRKIKSNTTGLILVCNNSVEIIMPNQRTTTSNYGSLLPGTSKIDPADALLTLSGELWVGDHTFGLIQKGGDGRYKSLVPSSPFSNNSRWLTSSGTNLYIATGNDSPGSPVVPAEIYRLNNQKWNSLNEYSDPQLSGIKSVTMVIPAPANPEHFWGATRGDGLIEFDGLKIIKHYDSSNSPLVSQNGNCMIGGLSYDASGNLWLTNPMTGSQLHAIKPDGTWKSFSYPGIDNQFNAAGSLTITKTDTKWIIVNHSDLFALRKKNILDNSSDQYRKTSVRSRFINSETTVIKGYNQINVVTEDHDGSLWVGTENGVVVYTDPESLFGNNEFFGVQPSVDLGDGLFHPLLGNELVTTISVDGANRKWIGTFNSGVFLFSSDGAKLINHFNTDNSPLFSNNVTSIAINHLNGEVFFATDRGLISWISDATEGNDSYQQLYVWPNPVRETYHGDITIDGLIGESDVKITDVAGNLVYKTISNGGRASWNGRNRQGNRVSTGVYLIFCTDSKGNKSRVIKLLFIH